MAKGLGAVSKGSTASEVNDQMKALKSKKRKLEADAVDAKDVENKKRKKHKALEHGENGTTDPHDVALKSLKEVKSVALPDAPSSIPHKEQSLREERLKKKERKCKKPSLASEKSEKPTEGHSDDEPAIKPKRAKKSKRSEDDTKETPQERLDPSDDSKAKKDGQILAPAITPKVSRRKSVTFTPDTKTADGNSAQRYFKAWVDEQKGADDSHADEQGPESMTHDLPLSTSSDKPSNKDIKRAKRAERLKSKPDTTAPEAPPYLAYLQRYYNDKHKWKFNKALQTDLLKNTFNLWRISHDYDAALIEYINGLQGEAAKQRLREAAQHVLDETEDIPPMESAHDDALRERLRKEKKRRREEAEEAETASPEFLQKLRKRKRAEEIMASLGPAHVTPVSTLNSQASGTATPSVSEPVNEAVKRKRQRKLRTGVPDDDDTSSSSEDDEIPSPAEGSELSSSEEGSHDDSSSVVSTSSSEPSSDSSSSDSESDSEAEDKAGSVRNPSGGRAVSTTSSDSDVKLIGVKGPIDGVGRGNTNRQSNRDTSSGSSSEDDSDSSSSGDSDRDRDSDSDSD